MNEIVEKTFNSDRSMVNVNVRIEKDQMITDSRNVAEVFGKRHDHVLRDIESIKKDAPNFGEMFYCGSLPDAYGREQKVYFMNRDGFTLLAMGFTGTDAVQWKLKYIEAFNNLEKAWNTPEQVFARALRLADKTINDLKEKIHNDRPKTLFAEAVESSEDSILIGDFAKVLCQNGVKIGQKRLFEWLRENGYLIKSGASKNIPMQKYVEQGLFEITERIIQNPDGTSRLVTTTKMTGKGQVYFTRKFLNNGIQSA